MFLMFYYLMYLSAVRLKHQFSRKVLPDLPRSPWSLPQPSWRTRSCGARKAGGLEWYLEGSAPVFADFLGVGMVPWSIETEFFTCFFFQKLGGKWLIRSQHSSWLWGCPEMGIPLNYPFVDGFSIIKQPILGVPSILGAPPYYHSDTMTRHTLQRCWRWWDPTPDAWLKYGSKAVFFLVAKSYPLVI